MNAHHLSIAYGARDRCVDCLRDRRHRVTALRIQSRRHINSLQIGTCLISDPWFYLLSIPALLLTNISKGGFGLGLGVITVPLMALRSARPDWVQVLVPFCC